MRSQVDDELIVKYLSGEASPEEAMMLDEWLQNPVNQFHFTRLQKTWNASYPGKSPRPVNVDKAWSSISLDLRNTQDAAKRKGFYPAILKVAASLFLLALVGIVLYQLFDKKPVDIAVETKDSVKQVRLADHSTITLFRNSLLTHPEKFNEQREVYLERGEAFFNVAHDKSKSFLVRTSLATIKVVGTSFNVVVNDELLEVSVAEGKVAVYVAGDTVQLEIGDAASLRSNANAFTIQKASPNSWSYATHKLVFDNTPLREVFRHVEKAQDCSIQITNANIGNCKVTATFERVSTEYMLTLITEALNLSVVKNDDRTFTVEGEGCY
jgi:ferric-dicitrate binding protein FerR (iron transport regulator)